MNTQKTAISENYKENKDLKKYLLTVFNIQEESVSKMESESLKERIGLSLIESC